MKGEKIVVLICDDDEVNMGINQKCVEIYSKRLSKDVEVHSFLEVNEKLIQFVNSEKVDIAILDVKIGDKSGIELAIQLLEKKPKMPIIFVTNQVEYKAMACDMLVTGYFEKPLHPEKFAIVYERAIAQIELERNNEPNKFLELCINRKKIRLRVSNILCIEKVQRKVLFRTRNGSFEVRGNLSDIVKQLNSKFLQISQSVIVNTDEVLLVDCSTVYLSTGEQYTIGRTFLKQVKDVYML